MSSRATVMYFITLIWGRHVFQCLIPTISQVSYRASIRLEMNWMLAIAFKRVPKYFLGIIPRIQSSSDWLNFSSKATLTHHCWHESRFSQECIRFLRGPITKKMYDRGQDYLLARKPGRTYHFGSSSLVWVAERKSGPLRLCFPLWEREKRKLKNSKTQIVHLSGPIKAGRQEAMSRLPTGESGEVQT